MAKSLQSISLIALIGLWTLGATPAWADEPDPAALAKALQGTTVTLQDGLKASEREGKPISGKFEIEGGALQLSVYTLKGDDLNEVITDPKTGALTKAEKITEADDLKDAAAQKAAMAKATVSLLAAADTAAKATGTKAISVYPRLRNGHPVAEVTLLQGTVFKKATEKLD